VNIQICQFLISVKKNLKFSAHTLITPLPSNILSVERERNGSSDIGANGWTPGPMPLIPVTAAVTDPEVTERTLTLAGVPDTDVVVAAADVEAASIPTEPLLYSSGTEELGATIPLPLHTITDEAFGASLAPGLRLRTIDVEDEADDDEEETTPSANGEPATEPVLCPAVVAADAISALALL
jgi:hypothetical protein